MGIGLPVLICGSLDLELQAMNKYYKAIEDLNTKGEATFKAFGSSMLPIIRSGSTLTFRPANEYQVGDIVFCKVRGRFIDSHKIVKKDMMGNAYRYQIANNKGHVNGWTKQVYGKVTKVFSPR